MTKTFWGFLVIGLIAVGILVSITWESTKGAHLELDGRILHVRTLAVNPQATIVVVDFRETNPSDLPFVLKDAQMKLEGVKDEPSGQMISKSDMATVFEYMKQLGPQYNRVFGTGDRIPPRKTEDLMVAARFELPESVIDARSAVHLYFSELNRAETDLVEKR